MNFKFFVLTKLFKCGLLSTLDFAGFKSLISDLNLFLKLHTELVFFIKSKFGENKE